MHAEDKTGRTGPDLGPMAGEISPNIMFAKVQKQGTRTAPDGYTWVRMGAVGCICTGGQGAGKQGETRQNSVVGACFAGVPTDNKNSTYHVGLILQKKKTENEQQSHST